MRSARRSATAIEHGYGIPADGTATALARPPGTIEVHGRVHTEPDGRRRAEFTIGMAIMRACADEVTVDSTPDGTTVVLHSRPLPSSPGRTA